MHTDPHHLTTQLRRLGDTPTKGCKTRRDRFEELIQKSISQGFEDSECARLWHAAHFLGLHFDYAVAFENLQVLRQRPPAQCLPPEKRTKGNASTRIAHAIRRLHTWKPNFWLRLYREQIYLPCEPSVGVVESLVGLSERLSFSAFSRAAAKRFQDYPDIAHGKSSREVAGPDQSRVLQASDITAIVSLHKSGQIAFDPAGEDSENEDSENDTSSEVVRHGPSVRSVTDQESELPEIELARCDDGVQLPDNLSDEDHVHAPGDRPHKRPRRQSRTELTPIRPSPIRTPTQLPQLEPFPDLPSTPPVYPRSPAPISDPTTIEQFNADTGRPTSPLEQLRQRRASQENGTNPITDVVMVDTTQLDQNAKRLVDEYVQRAAQLDRLITEYRHKLPETQQALQHAQLEFHNHEHRISEALRTDLDASRLDSTHTPADRLKSAIKAKNTRLKLVRQYHEEQRDSYNRLRSSLMKNGGGDTHYMDWQPASLPGEIADQAAVELLEGLVAGYDSKQAAFVQKRDSVKHVMEQMKTLESIRKS